jgi:hypothetical protein
MRLIVAVFIVCALLGNSLPTCAEPAGPSGVLVSPVKALPGAWTVQLSDGSAVKGRDVFQVTRGGKVVGEAMVMQVKGNSAVLLPGARFSGSLAKGDGVVFLRHAPVPVAQAAPVPAATTATTTAAQPGPASSPAAADEATLKAVATHNSVSSYAGTSVIGVQTSGTVTVTNGGSVDLDNVVVTVQLNAQALDPKSLGTLPAGQSVSYEWSAYQAGPGSGSAPQVSIRCMEKGTLKMLSVPSQSKAPQGGPGGPGTGY